MRYSVIGYPGEEPVAGNLPNREAGEDFVAEFGDELGFAFYEVTKDGPNNRKVIRDAAQLSSGTLATLTGETGYAQLDKIQQIFVEFVTKSQKTYTTWQEAWREFDQ